MSEASPPLVTKADLARQLGVSEQTIRRWAKDGVIPAIRINRQVVRFDPIAVARALEARSHSR